jgi:LuxR family maltose regulon positive regulatory protein
MQTLILLRQGDLAGAQARAADQGTAGCRALVHLARGEPAAALAVIVPRREEAEARAWVDERLNMTVLEALALWGCGEAEGAVAVLGAALSLGEPARIVRVFVDAGPQLEPLLRAAAARGVRPQFAGVLLAALGEEAPPLPSGGASGQGVDPSSYRATPAAVPLPEPLSARELEILGLIAAGRSNQEIGARLYLALDTVKGHNRRIFDKLGVQRRTEAVAKARALGLL